MNTFSASECIRFGWETFKKRPWFLVGGFVLTVVASSILNAIISNMLGQEGTGGLFAFLLSMCVQTLVSIGTVSFALKANDAVESVVIADLWRPQFFLNYLVMSVLFFVLAMIGLVLLIVPGVIVLLTFYFAGYVVVDRAQGPIAAMKESMRITKGHRWEILIFLLLVLLLNILGAIALVVGLFVTVPVTLIAAAHAYRALERAVGEVTQVSV